MNNEAPREPQRAPAKSSWLFTAVCCGYFLLGGWAAYKVFPIALRLNQRSRKTLGFETPASKLRASVAPTP
jgi:hypothetical protein